MPNEITWHVWALHKTKSVYVTATDPRPGAKPGAIQWWTESKDRNQAFRLAASFAQTLGYVRDTSVQFTVAAFS